MKTIPYGVYRGLQQCSTAGHVISALALDHRSNLRQALNPVEPDQVTAADLMRFKQQVTLALARQATAVLLDPEYGAFQCLAANTVPGSTGLIVSVEASGYFGNPASRESRLLPGWDIAKARRMGASAVKLLVYYHPDAPSAPNIENLVAHVADDCARQEIPFFLEPLPHSLDSGRHPLSGTQTRNIIVEIARRLTAIGGDVLKIEFPVDVQAEPDERVWQDACRELTLASRVPWVLLSGTMDFETYLRQVVVACQQGATGVAVGRAVWLEATGLSGSEREQFLTEVAPVRMRRITAACEALGRPWAAVYRASDAGPRYYLSY